MQSKVGYLFSICLSLLVFLTLTSLTAQTTVDLSADKDNTLYEDGTGAVSSGAGQTMFAGRTAPGGGGGGIRRGLVSFDITGIPEGATITSTILTLNMSRTNGGNGAQDFDLHAVSSDWGEGTSASGPGGPGANGGAGAASTTNDATWIHSFFNTTNWATAGGDFSGTISASQTVNAVGSYSWGSTAQMVSDVQGWVNGSSENFGWILLGNEAATTTAKRFDTRENGTVGNRPNLEVTYNDPVFDLSDVSINITANGLQSFVETGEQTAIDIDVTNINSSGTLQVQSFAGEPTAPVGVAGEVSDYRWVLTSSGFAVNGSGADIRINHTQITGAGVVTPSTVVIYQRTTPGSGTFSALTTAVDGDELVASISSFGEFCLGSTDTDNALPVSLSSFTAQQQQDVVRLDWITESETANEGFIVERSLTSSETGFIQVAFVPGSGNTNQQTAYSFIDRRLIPDTRHYYRLSDRDFNGQTNRLQVISVDVKSIDGQSTSGLAESFVLEQNYPNPFNPSTTIGFRVPAQRSGDAMIKMSIYDLQGKLVKVLLNREMPPGSHQIIWDARNSEGQLVSSGYYLYRLVIPGQHAATRKLLYIK